MPEPDPELTQMISDWGGWWSIYPPGPGAPCWLAYDRLRPDQPAVTAGTAGELADRMARLTPDRARKPLEPL